MYSWVKRVEDLLDLAKEMRADKDSCLVIDCTENKEEILADERNRFIALIPPEVPPTCRAVLIKHFTELYEEQAKRTTSKKGNLLCTC